MRQANLVRWPGALALCLLTATAAWANPMEIYGLGARSVGLAMADQGVTTDYSAAFANVAGLAYADTMSFSLGYSYFHSRFNINGQDSEAEDAAGVVMGLGLPFDLGGGWRFGSGLAAYVPEQRLARIRLLSPDVPRFLQFDNRAQRIVGSFSNALSWKWVSLGVGINIFSNANGRGALFRMKSGPNREDKADTDLILSLKTVIYPSAGLMIKPTEWLTVGFHWIRHVCLTINTTTDADLNLDLGFGFLTGHAGARISTSDYFTPETYSLAVEVGPFRGLTVMASVQYLDWAAYRGAITEVTPLIDLKLSSGNFNYETVGYRYSDQDFAWQVTAAGALEYRLDLPAVDMVFRGGYKYVPTPLRTKAPDVVVLDADRHVLGLGLGLVIAPFWILTGDTEINLGFQYQYMESGHRDTQTDMAVQPMDFDGQVAGGSLDVVLNF